MPTGLYFAESWRDYLGQAPDELPIARPTIALAAQVFRDEIVLMGLKARRPVSRPDVFECVTREVVTGLEFYGNKLAEPIGRMVSPLSLAPLVPMQGRFIYGGVADRLVHPREQAIRLWEHWGKPEIVWYPGGHTGFLRSQPVQRFVWDALQQSGLLDGSAVRRVRPA
jgi:hypothetical protein